MVLEFLAENEEVPEETAILLTSYYRKMATMHQAMESEVGAAWRLIMNLRAIFCAIPYPHTPAGTQLTKLPGPRPCLPDYLRG